MFPPANLAYVVNYLYRKLYISSDTVYRGACEMNVLQIITSHNIFEEVLLVLFVPPIITRYSKQPECANRWVRWFWVS